ncbi:MAG: hypothetical protein MHM6MM_000755 [Cercozoa sp. M6MM]
MQALRCLTVLRCAGVIHSDLKPENILLDSLDNTDITVIDFGSSCFQFQTMFSYIQSRFYRAPEVLLGAPYSCGIDMWSLGLIAAELFVGLPLLPGRDEHDQIRRIIECVGQFPANLLHQGSKTRQFFHVLQRDRGGSVWCLKSREEWCQEKKIPNKPPHNYFQWTSLDDLIFRRKTASGKKLAHNSEEYHWRQAFMHFLRCVLSIDPARRLSVHM